MSRVQKFFQRPTSTPQHEKNKRKNWILWKITSRRPSIGPFWTKYRSQMRRIDSIFFLFLHLLPINFFEFLIGSLLSVSRFLLAEVRLFLSSFLCRSYVWENGCLRLFFFFPFLIEIQIVFLVFGIVYVDFVSWVLLILLTSWLVDFVWFEFVWWNPKRELREKGLSSFVFGSRWKFCWTLAYIGK